MVRPAKPEGRLPVALITHGKNAKAADNQYVRADMMLAQARDLAARGWLAVVVIRRGYGQSDGIPGVSRGAAYMSCENGDLSRGFDVEADDLEAALKVIAERPDADGSRAIAIGQSLGGGAVLALAARRPAGLLGVVNVSGGVWRTTPEGNVCGHDTLVSAMATFGARTRVPSLWLYAENDSLFPPDLVNRMRDAYAKAGGRAELQMLSPVLHDGHYLFADFSGRVQMAARARPLSPRPPPAEHERQTPGAGDERGQAPYQSAGRGRGISVGSNAEGSRRGPLGCRNPLGCQPAGYRRGPQAGAGALPREVRRGMHRGDGKQRGHPARRDRLARAVNEHPLSGQLDPRKHEPQRTRQ